MSISSKRRLRPTPVGPTFDFDFDKKMNRALVYELATARFISQREDVHFFGPPRTGKSHLAQELGRAAIQQGYLGRRNCRFGPPINCRF